ncbi:MAG TPA: hypothetical protein PLL11_07360, partial [Spirochaetota bacterium]|nr:hypothetical protein [Spirochaetota bacterium]
MKKSMIIVSVCICLISCSTVKVQKESQKAPDMSMYRTISVGWIDFNGAQWKELGYKNQDSWTSCFHELNVQWFQSDLKKRLAKKTLLFGTSGGNNPKGDLAITFRNVKIVRGFDPNYIYMDIDFYAPAARKLIYSANVRIAAKGFGPQMWRFEGTLGFGMYNLSEFIESKL